MSNTQLSTYTFETHAIRTLVINNEPWFIATDICRSLNIANVTDALLKLDDDEKMVLDNTLGLTESIPRQVQEVNLVNDSGMYTLILRCRDAVKKGSVPHRFRKWVTAEVLPQIRKTGKYSVQQQLALPEPEKTFNLETTESTARDLIWALFATAQMHTLLGNLEPALQAIGSNFHPMVYSHHREYAPQIKTAVDFMKQLIQPFKESNDLDWQRLVHNLERIEAEQQNAQQKRAKHLPYRHF